MMFRWVVVVVLIVGVCVVMVMVFDKRVRVVHLGSVEQLVMEVRFVMSVVVLVVEPAIVKLLINCLKAYQRKSRHFSYLCKTVWKGR